MKIVLLATLLGAASAVVHKIEPTHVHAEHNGLAVELRHGPTEHDGFSRLYDATTGETFIQITSSEGQQDVQIMDHKVVLKPKSLAFEDRGDHEQLEEFPIDAFDEVEKMVQLKGLAQEVSKKGGNMVDMPITQWLHEMAIGFSKRNDKAKDKEEEDEETLLEEEEAQGWKSIGRRRRRSWVRRRRRFATNTSIGPGQSFCGNPCFGECGGDCGCWSFVCKNDSSCNQVHRGCYEHDCYCSCGGMHSARCWSFMAHTATCNTVGCVKWNHTGDAFCSSDPNTFVQCKHSDYFP